MSNPTIIRVTVHPDMTNERIGTDLRGTLRPEMGSERMFSTFRTIAERFIKNGIEGVAEEMERFGQPGPEAGHGDVHHLHIDADGRVWVVIPGDQRACKSPLTLAEPFENVTAAGYRQARETNRSSGWDALYLSGIAGSVPRPKNVDRGREVAP
jgi:hypothetical protein